MYTIFVFVALVVSTVSSNNLACRQVSDGFYADTSSGCVNFYRCVSGMRYQFTCPGGTLWSERLNTCDHARNVQCQSVRFSDERDYEPRTRVDYGAEEDYNRPGETGDFGERVDDISTPTPAARRPFYRVTTRPPPPFTATQDRFNTRPYDLPAEESNVDNSRGRENNFHSQFSTTPPIEVPTTRPRRLFRPATQSTTVPPPKSTSTSPTTVSTTTTVTTTPGASTTTSRRNLFTLRRRKEPEVVTSSTSSPLETTSARSSEDADSVMRSENWLVNGLPEVKTDAPNVTETRDEGTTEGVSEVDEDKSIRRRVRMQSGSNSLIGTMMKWASHNMPPSNDTISDKGDEREGKTFMKSPFDLTDELSTVRPLETPVTESNELKDEQGEQSSLRPIYFPPSVNSHLHSHSRSVYIAQNTQPSIRMPSKDETVHHPSPWSFPTGDISSRLTSSAISVRERREKYGGQVKSVTSPHGKSDLVGVISEGQCICSKP